jgi:hypothetical protein
MKYRYSVNNDNQLITRQPGKRKPLLTEGRFSIDKNNQLLYWLNKPDFWKMRYDLESKITFQGNWKINKNYDLELNLKETKKQYKGNLLILKGKIISIDKDTLVFEIKSYDKQDMLHIQILKLSGFWQADEKNQLSFMVKKIGTPDVFTLEGSWQLKKNQQIIYTYEKTDLKTKRKIKRTLTFEGFWQINSSNQLTYILSHSRESRFDFRAQIESPNLYPQDKVIKYRLGIGIRKEGQGETKIISLYGAWKFKRRLGLIFQMDYGKGKVHLMEFGFESHLSKKDEVIFSLTNKRNQPLGIQVIFTHKFLKQVKARSFLRFKKFRRELETEAGVRIPF